MKKIIRETFKTVCYFLFVWCCVAGGILMFSGALLPSFLAAIPFALILVICETIKKEHK